MTDTPIIRAARALMKSQSGVDGFEALDSEMQAGLLDDVRAVLEALRDPSKAMVAKGCDVADDCMDEDWESDADGGTHRYTTLRSDAPSKVFKAMIDAALSE